MRILFTIAHFYQAVDDQADYGSLRKNPTVRVQALTECIAALHYLFGSQQSFFNSLNHTFVPANQEVSYEIDVAICTTKDCHLLDELPFSTDLFMHCMTDSEPLLLGFECQELMRECQGEYDYYCYLEDDIILHDPAFFQKLTWFTAVFGDSKLLQPNRYEISIPLAYKAYLDGITGPIEASLFQDVSQEPQVIGLFNNRAILFDRPYNPHSGCYFLNSNQFENWVNQPYFANRDTRFVGPLESAATLGIMQTFQVYKASPAHANFLEVQHFGSTYFALQKSLEIRP